MENGPGRSDGDRVVVVGGGIVGACCAYALRRAGFDVTLIEKDEPGRAASFGNSGSIGLASTPPLGMPGMLKDAPRMLLDPMHPLVIRWGHLPRAWRWFVKFAQSLKVERVEAIAQARAALLGHAGDAYDDLLAEIGHPGLISRTGLLFAYESDAAFEGARYGLDLRRRTGIELREMSGDAMREMEPALSDKVRRGVFFPNVRTVANPLQVTEAVAKAYRQRGGRLLRETVRGFERGADGVTAVVTDVGRHPCDLVVVAAGAWSRDLVRQLGDAIPLEAERGYHIVMTDPAHAPAIPLVSADRNVSIVTMTDGLRMTTMAEFTSIDAPPDHARALRVFAGAAGIIRGLELDVASRWVGSRPSTPDSLPVISRSPRCPNVLYAFGHGHLGLTFGAVTGKLIAHLARRETPNIDLAPFRADRDYGGAHLLQQARR